MKKIIFTIGLWTICANVYAAGRAPSRSAPSSGGSNVIIEGAYDFDSINPNDLNTSRQSLKWNNTTASGGTFNQLTGFGASLGVKFFESVFFLLRYENMSQSLATTAIIGTSYTVADSFYYQPLLLLADYPIQVSESLVLSLRGGVGYAMQFEFREQNGSTGDMVKWSGNPIPIRAGFTLEYKLASFCGLFAETYYESVKSPLKAEANYTTTINGNPITKGQTWSNATTNVEADADLSGLHYGAGLRLTF